MKNLVIAKAQTTPGINFDFSSGILEIKGESYPENTTDFYAPIFLWLREFVAKYTGSDVILNVETTYLNSSSSKVFRNLFDLVDNADVAGKRVIINWIYDAHDEGSLEYGSEFKEDVVSLEFNLVERVV
jgi:hypothetical protein